MSYALDTDRNFSSSSSVNNYSATQASSGLAMMPTQLPSMSVSGGQTSFTPGYVNAPFATPYAMPFSSPELQRQFNAAGKKSSLLQPTNLRATDNFDCKMITIDGLPRGEGCQVKMGGQTTNVDLSGTNAFNYVSGGNQMNVVGDPNSQMCVVSYTDAFDTASFQLRPNGRFDACI